MTDHRCCALPYSKPSGEIYIFFAGGAVRASRWCQPHVAGLVECNAGTRAPSGLVLEPVSPGQSLMHHPPPTGWLGVYSRHTGGEGRDTFVRVGKVVLCGVQACPGRATSVYLRVGRRARAPFVTCHGRELDPKRTLKSALLGVVWVASAAVAGSAYSGTCGEGGLQRLCAGGELHAAGVHAARRRRSAAVNAGGSDKPISNQGGGKPGCAQHLCSEWSHVRFQPACDCVSWAGRSGNQAKSTEAERPRRLTRVRGVR